MALQAGQVGPRTADGACVLVSVSHIDGKCSHGWREFGVLVSIEDQGDLWSVVYVAQRRCGVL